MTEELEYMEKPPCPKCGDKFPNHYLHYKEVEWRCRWNIYKGRKEYCDAEPWKTPIEFDETSDNWNSEIECPVCKYKTSTDEITEDRDEDNCEECGSLISFVVEYSKTVTAHVIVPGKVEDDN